METMNQQNNTGEQAQETAQIKLDLILEQLRLRQRQERDFLNLCETHLGKESPEYIRSLTRWAQWHDAHELVNDIINNQ
jgi:hypothetical protein